MNITVCFHTYCYNSISSLLSTGIDDVEVVGSWCFFHNFTAARDSSNFCLIHVFYCFIFTVTMTYCALGTVSMQHRGEESMPGYFSFTECRCSSIGSIYADIIYYGPHLSRHSQCASEERGKLLLKSRLQCKFIFTDNNFSSSSRC
jgi:hypothetical protein